ncbi:hypothetical protein NDN08_005511 [Rhodosorus marinus]|uniref:S1 motif domain-containing protein n=1 Tax=Rhodosorus marinus TaxID=101924 RepID=A0AAV8V4B8_9RHOD|nr:hypothetical protein NDN08_005511 [Rhodosorus marinus]
MYENKYPEPDEIVMALVTDIKEMGIYVQLLEYNKCEGMIMLSELSRKRIRSIHKELRVGRNVVLAVVRVDKEMGYIDLSKRRVAPTDIAYMEDKWNKGRTVHSIMRHIAETVGRDLEDLYVQWGWPMYRKYGHAFDGFRLAASDADDALEGIDIPDYEREELLKNVSKKLTAHAIKFRADFEVECHAFDGIHAIKESLRKAEASAPEEAQVKVRIVAAPQYVINATSFQKAEGIQLLNDALKVVDEEIQKRGGRFSLKSEPATVSDKDEKLLKTLMKEAEAENEGYTNAGGNNNSSEEEEEEAEA